MISSIVYKSNVVQCKHSLVIDCTTTIRIVGIGENQVINCKVCLIENDILIVSVKSMVVSVYDQIIICDFYSLRIFIVYIIFVISRVPLALFISLANSRK